MKILGHRTANQSIYLGSLPSVLAFAILLLRPPTASCETRVLLAIGNDNYPGSAGLGTCKKDAKDVANTLLRAEYGFTPLNGFYYTDCNGEKMKSLVRSFSDATKGADCALFYFSGHGVQTNKSFNGNAATVRNFLLPIDHAGGEATLNLTSLDLEDVVRLMQARKNIIVLDSCRSNNLVMVTSDGARLPIKGSTSTPPLGLSRISAAPEFLIAYSSSAGTASLGGNMGQNSIYTTVLLQNLHRGKWDEVFGATRVDVEKHTMEMQKQDSRIEVMRPEESNGLSHTGFNFLVAKADKPLRLSTPPPIITVPPPRKSVKQRLHSNNLPEHIKGAINKKLATGDSLLTAQFRELEYGQLEYVILFEKSFLHDNVPDQLLGHLKKSSSSGAFLGPDGEWLVTHNDGTYHVQSTRKALTDELQKRYANNEWVSFAILRKRGFYLNLTKNGKFVRISRLGMPEAFDRAAVGYANNGPSIDCAGFGEKGCWFLLVGNNGYETSEFPATPYSFDQTLRELNEQRATIDYADLIPQNGGWMIVERIKGE